jgi:peptidoglycan/LPS O-acetylase OafA/YrhL
MDKKQVRFGAIHGMRGIAAMSVVLYHLSGNLQPELGTFLPNILTVLFSYGFIGVPIFFVISGFVISFSIGSESVTSKYVGNFILRRSVRLDLTYWASIFFALLLIFIKNIILGEQEDMPSTFNIFLHMFYLQELLNAEPIISVVYWTLCLEVQFYLFYVFSVWFSQKISSSNATIINLLIIIPLGIYSITLDLGMTKTGINGLFISNWHYFLMGVLVSQAIRKIPFSSYLLLIWLMIEITFQIGLEVKAYAIAGIFSAAAIFSMWKFDVLNSFFTGRVLSYFGTISYTLYLVHPDIGWKVISFGKLVIGDNLLPWHAVLLLFLGVAASILLAHIFHLAFEKPTQKMASRLKSESFTSLLRSIFIPKKSRKKDASKRASS